MSLAVSVRRSVPVRVAAVALLAALTAVLLLAFGAALLAVPARAQAEPVELAVPPAWGEEPPPLDVVTEAGPASDPAVESAADQAEGLLADTGEAAPPSSAAGDAAPAAGRSDAADDRGAAGGAPAALGVAQAFTAGVGAQERDDDPVAEATDDGDPGADEGTGAEEQPEVPAAATGHELPARLGSDAPAAAGEDAVAAVAVAAATTVSPDAAVPADAAVAAAAPSVDAAVADAVTVSDVAPAEVPPAQPASPSDAVTDLMAGALSSIPTPAWDLVQGFTEWVADSFPDSPLPGARMISSLLDPEMARVTREATTDPLGAARALQEVTEAKAEDLLDRLADHRDAVTDAREGRWADAAGKVLFDRHVREQWANGQYLEAAADAVLPPAAAEAAREQVAWLDQAARAPVETIGPAVQSAVERVTDGVAWLAQEVQEGRTHAALGSMVVSSLVSEDTRQDMEDGRWARAAGRGIPEAVTSGLFGAVAITGGLKGLVSRTAARRVAAGTARQAAPAAASAAGQAAAGAAGQAAPAAARPAAAGTTGRATANTAKRRLVAITTHQAKERIDEDGGFLWGGADPWPDPGRPLKPRKVRTVVAFPQDVVERVIREAKWEPPATLRGRVRHLVQRWSLEFLTGIPVRYWTTVPIPREAAKHFRKWPPTGPIGVLARRVTGLHVSTSRGRVNLYSREFVPLGFPWEEAAALVTDFAGGLIAFKVAWDAGRRAVNEVQAALDQHEDAATNEDTTSPDLTAPEATAPR